MEESIYDNMTRCEKEVANVLKEMGIKWSYERPVFVWDEHKRPRVWAQIFIWFTLVYMLKYVVQQILIIIIGERYLKKMVTK